MSQFLRVETELGAFILGEENEAVTWLSLPGRPFPGGDSTETPLLLQARAQLLEYLAGERQAFELPLRPQGTAFQRRVWDALLTIPYGSTTSYREVAQLAGSPKGYRAVGLANNRNPIPIFIPCHRVVGVDGSLTGYGGGLALKRCLLELEAAHQCMVIG